MSTADDATAWADKIDERLGPISGADADRLARFLRRVSSEIAGVSGQQKAQPGRVILRASDRENADG